MPRPKKCRKVCHLPPVPDYVPKGKKNSETVVLTVDEFESIRLIDKQGMSQEECANYMQVARTTAQQIYNSARLKIATALVDGKALSIKGGDYVLCDGEEEYCACGGCPKHRLCAIKQKQKEKKMKIAIPVNEDKNEICESFGRCPLFAIYDAETDKIEFIENPSKDSEGGAGVKASQVVIDALCDGIVTPRLGENSAEVLKCADIKIFKSQGKNLKENIELWKIDKLEVLTHFHGGYIGIK